MASPLNVRRLDVRQARRTLDTVTRSPQSGPRDTGDPASGAHVVQSAARGSNNRASFVARLRRADFNRTTVEVGFPPENLLHPTDAMDLLRRLVLRALLRPPHHLCIMHRSDGPLVPTWGQLRGNYSIRSTTRCRRRALARQEPSRGSARTARRIKGWPRARHQVEPGQAPRDRPQGGTRPLAQTQVRPQDPRRYSRSARKSRGSGASKRSSRRSPGCRNARRNACNA